MTTMTCPKCGGNGEVVANFSTRRDPQYDVEMRCPLCSGQGVIDDLERERQLDDFAQDADFDHDDEERR